MENSVYFCRSRIQYIGMGKELYDNIPKAAEHLIRQM